jgi:hypothetical protein
MIAYAVYQALPAQRENPRLQRTGWWVVLGGLANSLWIFLWHYQAFVGTLAAMLVLLASLIAVTLRLGSGQIRVSKGETWAVRVPFSIYLGWITVATVANVSDVIDFLHPIGLVAAARIWMVVILGAVLVIAGLMNFLRRDVAYAAVILWALAGIAARFPQEGIVTVATWVTFVLVAGTFVAALVMRQNPKQVKG